MPQTDDVPAKQTVWLPSDPNVPRVSETDTIKNVSFKIE